MERRELGGVTKATVKTGTSFFGSTVQKSEKPTYTAQFDSHSTHQYSADNGAASRVKEGKPSRSPGDKADR